MSDNPIKTRDLCERCKYGCFIGTIRACMNHCQCKMYSVFGCKCNYIKDNTPCPYFKEDRDVAD